MSNHSSYIDAYALPPEASGLPGEVAQRLADFIARKTKEVPERLEALCRVIEEKVLNEGVREGIRGIVRRFRLERRAVAPESLTESDWNVLVERIVTYGRTTTIENWSAYLFSMDSMPRLDGI